MPKLRSYNKRNEAVAAIGDGDTTEALALILVAFYDLALEYCAGNDIRLSRAPSEAVSPAREREDC